MSAAIGAPANGPRQRRAVRCGRSLADNEQACTGDAECFERHAELGITAFEVIVVDGGPIEAAVGAFANEPMSGVGIVSPGGRAYPVADDVNITSGIGGNGTGLRIVSREILKRIGSRPGQPLIDAFSNEPGMRVWRSCSLWNSGTRGVEDAGRIKTEKCAA